MSNHTLKVRDTIVIDLKHQAGLDIIQPEKVEIHIGGEFKNPIDIGALCYQTRTSKRTGVHSGFKTEVFVVEDTFLAHRRELISSLLETLATKVYRPATIRGYIQRISRAVDYIDENEGFAMLLRSKQDALSIYRDICAKLKDETQNSTITPHYASYMIDNIIRTLEIRFGKQFTDYLRHAFARVTSKKRKVAPRSDEAYKATFNFYHSIAEQISNFIIVNNSFPLKLKMPEYETYLFPNSNFLVTPYCNRPANIYDHEKGVIRSLNELWKEGEYIRRKYDLIHTISGSKETLNLANKEHSFARGNLVSKGLLSYRLLFMMLTGAYESEILQLESLDELEIDKCVVHKGFRAVKFRSAGRTVQYDLADGGVQVLKSYLKLRKYVLKGERHPQLFFNFLSRDWKPSKNRNELNRFQTRHIHGKLLPDKTKSITARECRKFKSVFLHEQPDVKKDTVKDVLNHSEKVNEEYYMDVSEDKASSELNDFWSAAKEAANHIRTTGKEPNTDSPIAAGHCESPHNPKQAVEDPPIFPNCKSQYGCLFCEHYVCHADDSEDIHKLFSLLYIVLGVLDGTSDMSKADELLKKLSVRVRSILNKVNNMSYASAQIVKKCRSLVFEYGELTPYWENRLQRYESLGLIFKEPPMGSEK